MVAHELNRAHFISYKKHFTLNVVTNFPFHRIIIVI